MYFSHFPTNHSHVDFISFFLQINRKNTKQTLGERPLFPQKKVNKQFFCLFFFSNIKQKKKLKIKTTIENSI